MSILHHNVKDLTGESFGRWKVLSYAGSSHWNCRCNCGTHRRIFTGNLSSGKTRSCGCAIPEAIAIAKTTHGLYGTPEYKVWAGIKRRCLNPNDKCFARYGGSGITICKRWSDSFDAFLSDMGKRPSDKHSIDRISNKKGYYPSNCRWATGIEQARNKTSNRLLVMNGRAQTLAEWVIETGLHHSLIQYRLHAGWSIERTLTTPARKCAKRSKPK
jgi:hypothetical protein